MAGLRAGALRHRIAIQRKVVDRDSNGAQVESWQTVPGWESVPAGVSPLSTSEYLQSAQIQSEIKGRIVIRYMPGLDATMRALRTDGMVYQFAGTPFEDPKTGRGWLTIPVSEGVIPA